MGIAKRFNGTQLEQELTKPCPLMPDGGWVHLGIHDIQYDSTAETPLTWSVVRDGDRTLQPIIKYVCNTGNIYIYLDNIGYQMGEVRCTFKQGTGATTQMSIQGSTGWRISPNGTQEYFFCSTTGAIPNSIGNGAYIDFYVYIIPVEDN